jgi:hypothetical protein
VSHIARAAIRGMRRSNAVCIFAAVGVFAVVAVIGVFLGGMVIIRTAKAAMSLCIRRSPPIPLLTAGKDRNAANTAVGVKASGVTARSRVHTGNSDHAPRHAQL